MAQYFLYLYVFCFVVGAVLLGASLLLGGKDADADADADLDVAHTGHLEDVAALGPTRAWRVLLSVRFWTFFLTFFALTGLGLTVFQLLGNPWAILVVSLAMGGGAAGLSTAVVRWLQRQSRTAEVPGKQEYVGRSARVLVPMERGGVGKVRVELGGQIVDVLATTDEEEAIAKGEEVLIVEMEEHRARVARLNSRSS